MSDIGRNSPCPCGSGRKYKHCCLNFPKGPPQAPPQRPPFAPANPIAEMLADLDPISNMFGDDGPTADMFGDLGMDPEDFEEILMPFFDHPGIIRTAKELKTNPVSPLTVLLELIHEHEPESNPDPIRLPEAISELAIRRVLELPGFRHLHLDAPGVDLSAPPNEEAEIFARRAAEIAMATLLEARVITRQSRSGRLVTRAAYKQEVDNRDFRRVYPTLFRTLATELLFGASLPFHMFEEMFGFGLLQLARSNAQPTRSTWFAADFFDALPPAREVAAQDPPAGDDTEEQVVTIRYIISIIYSFWCVLGLVDITHAADADHIVTARPLLGELVQFPEEWLRAGLRPNVQSRAQSNVQSSVPSGGPDFDDLSPHAMDALLTRPLHAPEVVTFAETVENDSAPIMIVLKEIIRSIENGELKATATGALPRAFARAIAPRIYSPLEAYLSKYGKNILKEADVGTLEMARIVLEEAGVIFKHKGRFMIGSEFMPVIDRHGVGGVYLELFRAAMVRYNWAYLDQMDRLHRIQMFAGFTLRQLARYGDEPRPATFYSDAFIRAFPHLVDEAIGMPESPWDTPTSNLAQLYIRRTFNQFGHTMGLVHITYRPGHDLLTPDTIEPTPLLREFIRFHA